MSKQNPSADISIVLLNSPGPVGESYSLFDNFFIRCFRLRLDLKNSRNNIKFSLQ